MQIILQSIATVHNIRREAIDDHWGDILSEITLESFVPTEAFAGIKAFSHLEIIFYFDKVDDSTVVFSGRPRGNPDYPLMGIFSQRKKDRPNKIGLCTVELLEYNERTIMVKGLDAIDGTPVLDIKPVFKEFLPPKEIKQPAWVTDLMKNYW
jgi:tRNA-Thr(GGU) m(6)t(6)A37 methyltransferase TsaA